MRRLAGALAAVALLVAGCGGGGDGKTRTVTRVEVVHASGGDGAAASIKGFDPEVIYKQDSPGVVTVLSVFGGGGGLGDLLGGDGGGGGSGLGSGFVLDGQGEIVTNAHVVTDGSGSQLQQARAVYVRFADGNQVDARVRGYDPNADVALLKVDPSGLKLRPLPLGDSDKVAVGSPVAAMGSPFGEEQSLSIGVVSAIDRSVSSLTKFDISNAIQTDAAINPGNSGGPLLDAEGRVIGLNQQIQTRSGGGEGVGFAVPINLAKRSVAQLREHGRVDYAFLGVSSSPVYPQLAEHFHLDTDRGAWIQGATAGGPAAKAGLRGGSGDQRFQDQGYRTGGDVIVAIGADRVDSPDDLSGAVAKHRPGQTVTVTAYRDGRKRTFRLTFGKRPLELSSGG